MSFNKLYVAAESGNLPAVIQLLAAGGVDINKSGVYQQTPLFIAAMKGHAAVVDRLLAAGANKEKVNVNQATPLFIAASNGHLQIVDRLLTAGAQKDKPNAKQATPLFAAAMNGHTAVVDRLLAAGADKDKSNANHATPLFIAASNGHKAIVERLLTAGANKDKPNINQATPLFIAAANGHKSVVERLLSAGANKEKPNMVSQTPLMIAAANGHLDVVMALLKDGADPNKRDKSGLTALQLAKKSGHQMIVEIFSPSPKWKGWSRSDVEQLNTLFETKQDAQGRIPAENVSVCPVCLKTVVRGEACMYMSHRCPDTPGFYHEELYNKYKNTSGRISWCTICNRICSGHRHYAIVPTDAPKAAELKPLPNANPFGGDADCRKYGGGGREEKIGRIRRLREYAAELNQEIGKITYQTAMNQLVEEMWNSPYYRTRKVQNILQTGKWNIQNNIFPLISTSTTSAPPPSVQWPFQNTPKMYPIIINQEGMNNITYETTPVLIELIHRQQDGSIRKHEHKISIQSLFDSLKRFGGAGTPEFGKCLFGEVDGCTGIHYPDELQYILDHYPAEHLTPEDKNKYQEMITNYRTRFNESVRDNTEFRSRIELNSRPLQALQGGGKRRRFSIRKKFESTYGRKSRRVRN